MADGVYHVYELFVMKTMPYVAFIRCTEKHDLSTLHGLSWLGYCMSSMLYDVELLPFGSSATQHDAIRCCNKSYPDHTDHL